MWTWNAIEQFYKEVLQYPRKGWEQSLTNAHMMLSVIPKLKQLRSFEEIIPYLSHGTLYLSSSQNTLVVSLYAQSPNKCKVTLHAKNSLFDTLSEYEANIDDISNLVDRHFAHRS